MNIKDLGVSFDDFSEFIYSGCPGEEENSWVFISRGEKVNKGNHSVEEVIIKQNDKYYMYPLVWLHTCCNDGEWDRINLVEPVEVKPVEVTTVKYILV